MMANDGLTKRYLYMVMVSFQMTAADALAISEGEVSQEYITLKLTTSPRVGHLSLTGTKASANGVKARFLGCRRKTTTKPSDGNSKPDAADPLAGRNFASGFFPKLE